MNDTSVISRQLSVSSNNDKCATTAEDMSEDSDESVNDSNLLDNPGGSANAVSIITASNFNFSNENLVCLANTNQFINLPFYIKIFYIKPFYIKVALI